MVAAAHRLNEGMWDLPRSGTEATSSALAGGFLTTAPRGKPYDTNFYVLDKLQGSLAFPGGAVVKNLPASTGDEKDSDSISGLGRSPGAGNGNPFQYSCLENSVDRGAWQATFYGVARKLDTTEYTHTHTHTHTQIFTIQKLVSIAVF